MTFGDRLSEVLSPCGLLGRITGSVRTDGFCGLPLDPPYEEREIASLLIDAGCAFTRHGDELSECPVRDPHACPS